MDWKSMPDGQEKRHAYYASREWALLKNAVRERCGGICEVCNKNPMQATHHLTYIRLYKERMDDLQATCEDCHKHHSGIETKKFFRYVLCYIDERSTLFTTLNDYLVLIDMVHGNAKNLDAAKLGAREQVRKCVANFERLFPNISWDHENDANVPRVIPIIRNFGQAGVPGKQYGETKVQFSWDYAVFLQEDQGNTYALAEFEIPEWEAFRI